MKSPQTVRLPIRLFKPSLGEAEIQNIRKAFEHAWLGAGPMVEQFEQAWSGYIGRRHTVALNSCTAALHMALGAHGFPSGSRVLVPAITFVSTAHAALYNGFEPVFVDVDYTTLTMDPEDLDRKAAQKSCVAVIPVHFGGQPACMQAINEVAKRRRLLVIEDCANCAGGCYGGLKLGAWGDLACFSFEEKKNMTTGDGGCICFDADDLLPRFRRFRWLGIDRDTWKRAQLSQDTDEAGGRHWYYEVSEIGFKFSMNDLAAAVGLAQLERLDGMNRTRAQLIAVYMEGLKLSRIAIPAFPYRLEESAYWLFMIRVPASCRDRLARFLRTRQIATGVHFMPIPLHPLYSQHRIGVEVALRAWEELLTLPLHPDLTPTDIAYIVDSIQDFERGAA